MRKSREKRARVKKVRKEWLVTALVVAAVVIGFYLRLKLWREMAHVPVEKDAALYCTMAQNIVRYGVFSQNSATTREEARPTAYTMPGYPLFLSGILSIFGDKPLPLAAIRFLQVLLSMALIILGYYAGRFLLNKWAGVINAFVMALYPANVFAPQLILTECLFTVLMVVSVYFVLVALTRGWEERGRYTAGLVAGVSFAAGFAIRPTLLTFLPFVAVYLVLDYARRRPKPSSRAALKTALAIFAPLLLFWTIWTARNAVQFGHFIPLTTSSNNPRLLGLDLKGKYTGRMFQLKGDEYEVNRRWGEWARAAFKENLREQPRAYVKYLVSKVIPLLTIPFGATPAEGWESMNWREEYWFYRAHRLLFWLALLGIVVLLPQRKEVWLVVALAAVFVFTHILYLGINRYGYPLIALLLNFVGVSSVAWGEAMVRVWRKNGWKKYVAGASVALALLFLLLRCPFMFPFFRRFFLLASVMSAGIVAFWVIYVMKWTKGWRTRFIALIVLAIFSVNFWGGAQNFRMWGITPERIYSFGYLYSDRDVIEQIIDLPAWTKAGEAYYLYIESRRGSSAKPTYTYQIYANTTLIKEIRPEEYVPQKLRVPVPADLIQKSDYLRVRLRLQGKVDVYAQYVLVNLRLDRFSGISLFDGQMRDLSYRKGEQQGTFVIGLIVKKREVESTWFGSPRDKLLGRLTSKQ
jgi:4-amino-4-deoxy-L-arabinose transferase-like glycosyltransferase